MLYVVPPPTTEALSLLETCLNEAKIVAVDTETNGKDVRDGRGYAMGVSLSFRRVGGELESFYLPFQHINGANLPIGRFRELLQRVLDAKPIVFHNAKFDLVSLETLGLSNSKIKFFDTMLIAHMLNENLYCQGLDSLTRHFLKDPGKKNQKGSPLEIFTTKIGWEPVPVLLVSEYAAYDTDLTLRLFEHLWPLAVKEGLDKHWPHRAAMVRLVIAMERNGVGVNTELCYQMAETGVREMERLQTALGGYNPASHDDLEYLLFGNLNLPIIARTPTGKPKLDKKVMEEYEIILGVTDDDTARQILAYRGWQKSVSSNYTPYVEKLSPDGRLRTNFKLHGTVSWRFSSEKPNLQQIPRSGVKPWNGRMKQCFIPENDDWVLVEADYSQLEFRLASAYADEKLLLDAFNTPGRDVFSEMATDLKMERDDVKTMVYSIQYGAGVNRISNVFGLSREAARDRIDNYYLTYPGFKRASGRYANLAAMHRKVEIWTGHYRHFMFPDEYRKAFNSLIQGGAAAIMERTMLRADAAGLNDGINSRMNLQVHDSLVFEVRRSALPEVAPVITQVMESVEPNFGVHFASDLHFWGTKDKVLVAA